MLSRRSFIVAGGGALLSYLSVVEAQAGDEYILEVAGRIAGSDQATPRHYSRYDLEQLGTASFTVHTPWYAEPCTFEGVPLDTLMDHVKPLGQTARVSALNDYAVDIPLSDFTTYRPILAIRRDGKLMPVSDKGPLFIVYNYDALPELQHQVFYSRSVWQVNRIEIL